MENDQNNLREKLEYNESLLSTIPKEIKRQKALLNWHLKKLKELPLVEHFYPSGQTEYTYISGIRECKYAIEGYKKQKKELLAQNRYIRKELN